MLEGELLVHIEREEHRVGQGVSSSRRGIPHAMMVTSETAHILALQTPGTGEAFYRAAGEPARSAADASRYDSTRLRDVAERCESIELLGPPPFALHQEAAAVRAAPGGCRHTVLTRKAPTDRRCANSPRVVRTRTDGETVGASETN